jgi:cyclophilin family peptidyl-prolyl cis-trans isomerase
MNRKNTLWAPLALLLLAGGCQKAPVADFEASTPAGPPPAEVQFTNKSQNADRYEWVFGDGQTSAEESPKHVYQTFGEMTVVLRAFQKDQASFDTLLVNIPEPPRRRALVETDFGNITIELSNRTPQHRDNFVKLVEEQYYDELLFHRVISGFMIQGGDPDSKNASAGQMLGSGGPGYTVPAEILPGMPHVKGAVAAARIGGPSNPEKASSGSQFYIVQGNPVDDAALNQMSQMRRFDYLPAERDMYLQAGFGAPFLDRDYTVFGYVTEGLDVIDKIAAVEKGAADRPKQDVRMKIRMIQ